MEFDLYVTPGNPQGVESEGHLPNSIALDHIKIFMV